MKQKLHKKLAGIGLVTVATLGSAAAQATPPVNLSTAGTDAASFIPTAAGWGLPVLIGMVGLGIVIKAFRKTAR